MINTDLSAIRQDPFRLNVWNLKYGKNGNIEKVLRYLSKEISKSVPKEVSDKFLKNYPSSEEAFYNQLMFGKFLPGGRVISYFSIRMMEEKRHKLTPMNCYVIPILEDSLNGIFKAAYEMALTYSWGGGCGADISSLRPRGSQVLNAAVSSTGSASFMPIYDAVTFVIGQKGRRGALLLSMNYQHPDIIEFMESKKDGISLENMNISIKTNDEFFKAVEKDAEIELWYPHIIEDKRRKPEVEVNTISDCYNYTNVKTFKVLSDDSIREKVVYKTIKAKKILDIATECACKVGCPGILFWNKMMEDCPYNYIQKYTAQNVNPCLAGDTLIAVADGRNAISIKQLSEEDKDIPVYCYDDKNKEITIRMGRNPRLTRKNQQLYRVTLDDGSFIRVTGDHKWLVRQDDDIIIEKATLELKYGDSLISFNKNNTHSKWAIRKENKYINYITINNVLEHRLIAEFKLGRKLLNYPNEIAHHIDENIYNNSPENIEVMSQSEHNSLHWKNMPPEKNGMFGKIHSDETKNKIRNSSINKWKNEEFRIHCKQRIKESMTEERRKRISKAKIKPRTVVNCTCKNCNNQFEIEIIKDNKINQQFCSTSCAGSYQFKQINSKPVDDNKRQKIKEQQFRLKSECPEKYIKDRKFAAIISSKNKAKKCGNMVLFLGKEIDSKTWNFYKDLVHENNIHHFIQSKKINELWDGDWNKFIEDCKSYNHKIVSIEKDSIEDVYNLTVDDFHNYAIISSFENSVIHKKYSGIIIKNCAEEVLPAWGCCNLASINLSKFVDHVTGKFNFEEFGNTVRLVTIFLDTLNTVAIDNKLFPLEQQVEAVENLRLIGIGITGLGDALILARIKYDSNEAISFIEEIMKFKEKISYETSIHLAQLLGSYKAFDYEKAKDVGHLKKMRETNPEVIKLFDEIKMIRNAQISTIAPAGTISQILGCSTGVEPVYATEYDRTVKTIDEPQHVKHWLIDDLIELGILDKNYEKIEYIRTAYQIKPSFRVQVQAIAQKYTDGSISSTINLPKDTTPNLVKEIYSLAYKSGCKGITVYRQGSKDSILKTKDEIKKDEGEIFNLDNLIIIGETIRVPFDPKWYITLNTLDGTPVEVFINAGKSGSDDKSWTEAFGRLISISLQGGIKIDKIIEAIKDNRGNKTTMRNGWIVHSGPDAIAKALIKLLSNKNQYSKTPTLEICPNCHTKNYVSDGCGYCTNCGYSACG